MQVEINKLDSLMKINKASSLKAARHKTYKYYRGMGVLEHY